MYNTFNKLFFMLLKLRIYFLEQLYKIHLRMRYAHDVTYQKGGWYKVYSDKRYTASIHKVVLLAFLLSLIVYGIIHVY